MSPGFNKDIQRVFVVGMARSGTTLVQSVLNAHSKIISFPETHFLSKSILLPKYLRFVPVTQSGVDHANTTLQKIGATDKLPNGLRFSKSRWTKEVFLKLDQLAVSKGFDTWVEKTPLHLLFINLITRALPGSRFIHVIRNPIDNINSLVKASNEHPRYFSHHNIEKAMQRYKRDLSASAQYFGDKNHYFVMYDNFVKNPARESRAITAFLQLKYEPKMLDYKKSVDQIIEKDESWKSNNLDRVKETGSKMILSTEDKDRIMSETNSVWNFWEQKVK